MFLRVWLASCAVWVAFELWLLLFKRAHDGHEDRGSLALLWLTTSASVALANVLGFRGIGPALPASPILRWFGPGLIIAGVVVRVAAIRTLGRFFTANVATADDQPLIAVGLYRKIRHPSYLGSLVCFLGLGVALGRWVSLAVSLCPATAAFIIRIHVEEKALIRRFGDSYLSYSRGTYRLLPPIF